MKATYIYTGTLALIMALQWSCIRDDLDISLSQEADTEVSIDILVPGRQYGADTRALSEANENHVEDVVVLVFDNSGNFQQRADARTVQTTADENVKRFNIKLKVGQSDLWIFANCKSLIDAYTIPANSTKQDIRENLLLQINGKWSTGTGFTPLPMWGERTGVNIIPDLSITGAANRIPLIRAVAKVDVTVDRATVSAADFILQSVNLYHWSNQDRVVADDAAFGTDKTIVERISGGTGSTTAAQVQTFVAAERDTDGFFTNVIYVPETPTGSTGGTNNPCIVVNATYQGIAGWYKAEFMDENVTGDVDRHLPLLRNHRYNFEIVGVGGRGYSSADEAYRSTATNLIVRIHTHDDATLTNVMYDGQYWLAWDPEKLEMFREAHPATDTDNIFQIETNCENGWSLDRIVDAAGQSVTWLSVPEAHSGAGNLRARLHFVTTENDTGAPRTAFVHFSAGRMDMTVEVTQSNVSNVRIRILDENGAEVSGTVWLKTPQGRDVLKEYTINWLPKNADVVVTAQRTGANDLLFETGRGITAGTLQDDGKHEYGLRLEELYEARDYYDNNNTLRTFGNQYTFTVTDHGVTASTSIDLRHHLDMIATNIDTLGYSLGFPHNYTFFSTTSYQVTGIADPAQVQIESENKIRTANVTVADGNTTSDSYAFRLRNPNIAKDEERFGIQLTFPCSELPDTTVYVRAYYLFSNSHMVVPGTTVRIPVKQALRNYRHEWFGGDPLPDLSGMTPEVMWSTVSGLITSVKMTPTLDPDPDPMTAEIEVQVSSSVGTGNALISLEAGGTVIWSWHIWVTNYVPGTNGNPEGTAGTGLFSYSSGNNQFIAMDRNLGALGYLPTPATNRNRMGGMYYQGGRKDPFPYSDHIEADGSTNKRTLPVTTNMTNLPVNRKPFTSYTHNSANAAVYFNLRRSIEEPTTYILAPDHPYDWLDNDNTFPTAFRWFAFSDGIYRKSIWDPCPDGWQVSRSIVIPPEDILQGLRNYSYGITRIDGNYWPAAGWINHNRFNYENVGFDMIIRTYAPGQGDRIDKVVVPNYYSMYVFLVFKDTVSAAPGTSEGQAGTDYVPMARGLPVRCMRETSYPSQYD